MFDPDSEALDLLDAAREALDALSRKRQRLLDLAMEHRRLASSFEMEAEFLADQLGMESPDDFAE